MKDLFLINREDLTELTEWTRNIVDYHFKTYEKEDIARLKALLDYWDMQLIAYSKHPDFNEIIGDKK